MILDQSMIPQSITNKNYKPGDSAYHLNILLSITLIRIDNYINRMGNKNPFPPLKGTPSPTQKDQ